MVHKQNMQIGHSIIIGNKVVKLILIVVLLIGITDAGWVQHTCRTCKNTVCPSGYCYALSGSGYPEDSNTTVYEICSDANCTNESPFGVFGEKCSFDQFKARCSTECCAKQRHGSLKATCTDNFPSGQKFCSEDFESYLVAGIIAGSLAGFCILCCVLACVVKIIYDICNPKKEPDSTPEAKETQPLKKPDEKNPNTISNGRLMLEQ